jgi:phospholipid/cholesterol/gamma-HCH transport system substrate-binding protein
MARHNPAEIITGAVVLLLAAGFLGYAIASTGRSSVSGYPLTARFSSIDGLASGSDVRLAGVKVGNVAATSIDPQTFQAVVSMQVGSDIKLPKDSSAAVTSDGLLGGKYIAISPGGDDQTIPAGGAITITQGSVSLEQLLGKFIFSVTDMVNAQQKPGEQKPAKP